MHQPGIEPRANAWKAFMLPLHHWCSKLMTSHNDTTVHNLTSTPHPSSKSHPPSTITNTTTTDHAQTTTYPFQYIYNTIPDNLHNTMGQIWPSSMMSNTVCFCSRISEWSNLTSMTNPFFLIPIILLRWTTHSVPVEPCISYECI